MSFLSIFLGLVLGHQTVAVEVTEPVARVEILLDGHGVATLTSPPWRKRIDLGGDLIPHELTAVGFDHQGIELDRVVQWLNLPRRPAEITILLEGEARGTRRTAKVSWESLAGDEPSAWHAVFDGLPIDVEDPRLIRLPDHDPSTLHFFRLEMEFGDLVSSSAEITFGGEYTDQVNTELTAFAVELAGRKKLPAPEELQSAFTARDQPLRVAAVDKGQAELVIVRDRGAWSSLRRIRGLVISGNRFRASAGSSGQMWFRPYGKAWSFWSFQFLWPVARRLDDGESHYDLFSHSQKYMASAGSLHGWITTVEKPREQQGSQRLADAVAIAGVTVTGGSHRRGVLLVLGHDPQDASEAKPETVKRYLESLGVPLFVWTSEPGAGQTTQWGAAVNVSTPELMSRATLDIFHALERQRIVWLEGIYLPHEISLRRSLRGVRLVSAP